MAVDKYLTDDAARFETWLGEQWDHYRQVLMLTHHTMRFERMEQGYFEVTERYPYLDYVVRWSNEALKEWLDPTSTGRVQETVVHEFCHLLVDPLYQKAKKRFVSKGEIKNEHERLTEHISRIVTTMAAVNGSGSQ